MNKKDNQNRINDSKYFEDLESKMMQYAEDHGHPKMTVSHLGKGLWIAAACLLAGLAIIFLIDSKNSDQAQLAQNQSQVDTAAEFPNTAAVTDLPEEILAPETQEVTVISTSLNTKQQDELMETISDESVELIMEEELEEESILDLLTEEELDELLKEYT